jgi:hypothetical protein
MDGEDTATTAGTGGIDGATAAGAAVAIAVVVLAAVLLVSGALSPHLGAATPSGVGAPGGNSVPAVNVTSSFWTGANDSVTNSSCPAVCSIPLAAGATFTFAVSVVADCDVFGCATTVSSIDIPSPFLLISSLPALPAPFFANFTELNLSVKAPSAPGNYPLIGKVIAGGLPPVVTFSNSSWGFSYTDATNGTFASAPTNNSTVTVRGGATFSVTIPISAINGTAVEVNSFAPPTGFVELTSSPIGPFTIQNGTTANFLVTFRAPAGNWSGYFNGTISTVVLDTIVVTSGVIIDSDPYYQPAWSISPSNITGLQPSAVFNVYATFQGGPDVSYTIAYTLFSASGNITLNQVTPTGTLTVTSASVTFTFRFQLPPIGGDFQIYLEFTEH